MEDIKLNLEGIHIDMSELIEKYNGKMQSVSDTNEIQQISLFCQNNRNDYRRPVLMDMINNKFAFAGLYPHLMKSIEVDPKVVSEVTGLGEKHIREILESVEKARKKKYK